MSTPQRSTERYRRVRLLGQGGMATVELAQDTELDRPVAIKRLAENLAANRE
jgi:eukaryotic-like serine/threonine-protein kinase